MNILAFAASSSRHSINRVLIEYSARIITQEIVPDAQVDFLDLNDFEMPIYSIDREKASGVHPRAQMFFDKITAADALLISYAEHNGFYTAAFKNVFDWASRISLKVFQDKPMVALSTSIGARGGENVLRTAIESAPFFGADIKASLPIGTFQECFDPETQRFHDDALHQSLSHTLASFTEV